VPFVGDPSVQRLVATLLEYGLGALAKYALKNVFPSEEPFQHETSIRAEDVKNSLFLGNIYANTVNITNHINNIGGVEEIELIPDGIVKAEPVRLTSDTQDYVREIKNKSFRGPMTEITGYVTRLLPNRQMAEIKLKPRRYVRVWLAEDFFHFVRYETETAEYLRFRGRPIIQLGQDMTNYREFDAESVEKTGITD
jgi:hypothetical protein